MSQIETKIARVDSVLDINLDDDDVLGHPPSIILYSRPGAGKSTAIAQSFQNLFWIQTSKTVLRPYASWLRDNVELAAANGMSFPTGRRTIVAIGDDGVTPLDVRGTIIAIVQRYAASVKAGTCPYNGLVFDEYNELMRLVFDSIKRDPKFGSNPFDAINELKRWNKWLCSMAQTIDQIVALVTHEREPTYDDKPGSTKKGSLLYKGGPAFPIGTEVSSMAAAADICIRIGIKKVGLKMERVLLTQIDPLWEIKFRDMKVDAEEKFDLRALLLKAGYPLERWSGSKKISS